MKRALLYAVSMALAASLYLAASPSVSHGGGATPPVPERNPNCPLGLIQKKAVLLPGSVFAEVWPAIYEIADLGSIDPDGTQAEPGVTKDHLDLTCGEGAWMMVWEEDEDGKPIPGSGEVDCVVD